MYSDKVRAFIESHLPAEKPLTIDEIVELAKKAGLEVYRFGQYPSELDTSSHLPEGTILVVAWGELSSQHKVETRGRGPFAHKVETGEFIRYSDFMAFENGGKIHYTFVVKGVEVVFTPHVSADQGGGNFGIEISMAVSKRLVEAAGLHPFEVDLPEPIVRLPWAPWTTVGPSDWGGMIYEDTIECFQSEAAGHVLPFVQKLLRLLPAKMVVINPADLKKALEGGAYGAFDEEAGLAFQRVCDAAEIDNQPN